MKREFYYYVYILASKRNGTLYIGLTNNVLDRNFQHKIKLNKKSFTARYNVTKLFYYEIYANIQDAIAREKQLKKWKRQWKIELMLAQLAPRILRGYCGAIKRQSDLA